MRRLLAAIALDLPAVDAQLLQLVIEQHARARAALPVDKDDVIALQVGQVCDLLGIAARHEHALDTLDKAQDHHVQPLRQQQPAHGADVEIAGLLVEQMAAGQVCLALHECDQPQ